MEHILNEPLTNKQYKLSKWFIKRNINKRNQYRKYPQCITLNYDNSIKHLSKRNIYYYNENDAQVYFFEDKEYVYMFVDIDIFNSQFGIEGCPMMLFNKHNKNIVMWDDTKIEISDI